MASLSTLSSLLKTTIKCLSLFQSTRPTSSATTTVSDDFEKLEGLLPRIKAVLLDAEKSEFDDESVKLWLKEIKDVAHDAEDVLDEYKCQVLRAKVENGDIATSEASRKRKRVQGEEEVTPSASSGSNSAVSKISILNSMAKRITSIRKRFEEISKDRHDLKLKPGAGQRVRGSRSEYPPPTSHMIDKQNICGREVDKAELINWLFSNRESKFEVRAVVGKGGLGKTTLAQLVYNDKKVSDYFHTRIWICVSEDFVVTRLTRAMVESITKKPCTLSDQLSLLQESLREELQGKRVLLVLDDVWDDKRSSWESLRTPLKENGAEMVRIIVTTRINSVAEIVQTRKNPYRLGHMPEDQCWELFKRHAFCGRDPEEFPSLLAIGKKIVKKCDGLPLSVKSLGGLLQHEREEDGWKDVLQSRLWELDTKEILPALKLSYIRMPSHLKPCFEICSIFPKDYLFSKDELVRLWVANGYIQHAGKDDGQEKGYKYFEELRRRSFIDGHSWWDCKMHDNIHDLAHYVHVGRDSENYKHKIRHLAIKNESFEFNVDAFGALRTLIMGGNERISFFEKYRLYASVLDDVLGKNITRFTQLRYLSIRHDWSEDEFLLLEGLSNFICLRYLELYSYEKLTLTKSIGHLYNLVVLEITCYGLVELPEDSFGSLVSLTTISFRGFENDQLPALGQLPSLRSLTLHNFHNVESIGSEFYRGQKKNNDHHHAAFPSLTSLVFEELTKLKKWDELQEGDFPGLQKLKITSCESLSSLPWLGNLSLLSHMRLDECDSLQLSSLPPNLKTLESFAGTTLRLSQQEVGEPKRLESLRGIFWARNEQILGILNNLSMSTCDLNIAGLKNIHNIMEAETNLKTLHQLERLTLKWRNVFVDDDSEDLYEMEKCTDDLISSKNSLWLIVENDNGDGANQIENESFFLLEKLQPHTNLEYLRIENYDGVGYPRWIGDPSFNRLTKINLHNCRNDQLPTLGQLPSLRRLTLDNFYNVESIGSEFYRGQKKNNNHHDVGFPSLTSLVFNELRKWKKWDELQEGDFPRLQNLQINHCESLSSLSLLGNLSLLSHVSLRKCGLIHISSFPPNLKTLKIFNGTGLRMRNDQVFGSLNNLPINIVKLCITGLKNVHDVMEAHTNLKSRHRLERLTLKWNTGNILHDDDNDFYYYDDEYDYDDDESSLCLVVEDDNGDETNQIENESFLLLEKLQPHTNLKYLCIENYDGVGYPSWITHTSFDRLTEICLDDCKNDQLPTLGQLPSLERIDLRHISDLKIIGDEFCRGTMMNNDRDSLVAFPSLKHMCFRDMSDLEEWYGVLDQDFPQLQKLEINHCKRLSLLPSLGNLNLLSHVSLHKCDSLQLSSFPPNLKTLESFSGTKLRLSQQKLGELKKLESLSGIYWARNDQVLRILNNLPMGTRDLSIAGLKNVHNVMEAEINLKSLHRLERLTLQWRNVFPNSFDVIAFTNSKNSLWLIMEDDDDGTNQIQNESFNLLEKLQPHTNLHYLRIENYDSVGYPSWIGHPSFDKLTEIRLDNCRNDRLPTLGQLPSLERIDLRRISEMKIIEDEFCRGTMMNNDRDSLVAFPSLKHLCFHDMSDWEEWYGVLDQDFPQLQKLEINHCKGLSSLPSFENFSLLSHVSLHKCDSLQLSSFPPNLKTLESFSGTKLRLSQQKLGELKKLESLRGIYWVRNDQVLGILNNLPMSTGDLNIAGLKNIHNVMEAEINLQNLHRLERLTLKWNTRNILHDDDDDYYYDDDDDDDDDDERSLCLVVEDDNDDVTNKIENESFFLLAKLQPHTNLEYLHIENYDGVGYPSWIAHPSFDRLTEIRLHNFRNDQLPTLCQLPSLESIDLRRFSGLKIIGDEFCRGTMMNNDPDSLVAFPSLKRLCFRDMSDWEEWYGVLDQDFPQLHKLEINRCKSLSSLPLGNLSLLSHVSLHKCGSLQLSSFPSNLKTLESFSGTKLLLSQQEIGELKKLENLRGIYCVRNDQVLRILNNLPMNTGDLNIAGLKSVHNIKETEINLKSLHRLERLTLKWNTGNILHDDDNDFYYYGDDDESSLFLVVEDDNDNGTNQIENESFFLLEKLQPHTNLEYLHIENYDGVGYPSWIAHPSFDRLTEIRLCNFRNDQLPTLGQLPSLESIDLRRISDLKIIGDEFCRGTMMNNDHDMAFPSLTHLYFHDMPDWEEWYGVLDQDFPQLERLRIEGCPSLRTDLYSFPHRLLKYRRS